MWNISVFCIFDIPFTCDPSSSQLPGVGVDKCHLWLVASGDRRVSVWASEWSKDQCQLVDWLTFPGPFFAPDGTRLKKGDKVSSRKVLTFSVSECCFKH